MGAKVAIRELTGSELLHVAGGTVDEIVVTGRRVNSDGGASGGGYSGGFGGGSYGGGSYGGDSGGGGGTGKTVPPVPKEPQTPLPPVTTTPITPEVKVSNGVSVGADRFNDSYGNPFYGGHVKFKF